MDIEQTLSISAPVSAEMPNTPKVSIGMPVYNGEPFIREAIDSLLAQTFTDFELIISDNASTDGTEAICREYAAKDARIRYVRQAENRGPTANFQFVLDEAVGEYFMWAAADDLQKPTFVEKLVNLLDQHKDLCCAMSDVENIFDQSGKDPFVSYLDDIRTEYVLENWKKCRKRFFRNPTSNVFFCIYGLFRTEKLKRVELNYRGLVKYASASEVPFLAKVSLFGRICSISEPLKIYRRHASSIFHEEQSRFLFRDRLNSFLNVSHLLLRIITDSPLPALEKMSLYATVLSTSGKWFISFLLRSFRKIRGLVN
jgi:glycosyltransferase involved in cell wall biosynthesis